MIRNQIQLPDELYREAKRIYQEQEIGLAEARRSRSHVVLNGSVAERRMIAA